MSVKLTADQMGIVQGLMEFAQAFCNEAYHIMVNHGLDKVDGCFISASVDPSEDLCTKVIGLGEDVDKDFGKIRMTRGMHETKFTPLGTNSAEYELMFADDSVKEAMRKFLNANKEKPYPEDGLWVGKDYGEE